MRIFHCFQAPLGGHLVQWSDLCVSCMYCATQNFRYNVDFSKVLCNLKITCNTITQKVQSNPALQQPLNIDTLLLRTVFFVPVESPYIFSKFNPLNINTRYCGQRKLFSCPMNRFSYKVNLANADTLLFTVCCNF